MTRRRILFLTSTVYLALFGLGVGFAAWAGRPWVFQHPEPWLELSLPWSVGASLAAGVVIAGATVLATRVMVRHVRRVRDLHLAFREMLAPLDGRALALIALASGVGEEVFFRGALQPTLGLTLTSVLFGLLHVGPDRRFLTWTVWAVVMGFVRGLGHEATGSLAGCVLAHVLINYENLQFIVSYDPREPPRSTRRAPSLVGREERR